MERDNYVDLRIKDFPQEYPQFRAASACPGSHNRNTNEQSIPVENVDLRRAFEVFEQATEVRPCRRAVGVKLVG